MLDFMASGMTVFVCCIIIANLKILILSYSASVGLILVVSVSIGLTYVVYVLVEAYLPYGDMQNMLYTQVHSFSYWGSILASTGLILTF